jgi:hypothetical protein
MECAGHAAASGLQATCAICYCLWCWLDPLLGGGSAAFAMASGFFGWLSDRGYGESTRRYDRSGNAFDNFEAAFSPRPPYKDRWGRWTTGPGRLIYFSEGLQGLAKGVVGEDIVGTVPSSGKA